MQGAVHILLKFLSLQTVKQAAPFEQVVCCIVKVQVQELKVQMRAEKGTDSYTPLIHSPPATPDQHHQLWPRKLLPRF